MVQGFYTVYSEVFEGLSKHESEAAERAGKKGPSPASFGRSDSPWSEVSAFYRYWLQFVSDREFGWADVHNLSSAPNRKVTPQSQQAHLWSFALVSGKRRMLWFWCGAGLETGVV